MRCEGRKDLHRRPRERSRDAYAASRDGGQMGMGMGWGTILHKKCIKFERNVSGHRLQAR